MAAKTMPQPESAPDQMPVTDAFAKLLGGRVQEGEQKGTMLYIAGCLIKRYGNTEEALEKFLKKAKTCDSPLDPAELKTIWNSAVKFAKKLSARDDYIPPEAYNNPTPHKPEDYSDVGEA